MRNILFNGKGRFLGSHFLLQIMILIEKIHEFSIFSIFGHYPIKMDHLKLTDPCPNSKINTESSQTVRNIWIILHLEDILLPYPQLNGNHVNSR